MHAQGAVHKLRTRLAGGCGGFLKFIQMRRIEMKGVRNKVVTLKILKRFIVKLKVHIHTTEIDTIKLFIDLPIWGSGEGHFKHDFFLFQAKHYFKKIQRNL